MKTIVVEKKISIQSTIIMSIMFIGFFSIIFQFILKNVVWDIMHIRSDRVIDFMKTGDNPRRPDRIDEDGWSSKYSFAEEPAYKQTSVVSTRAALDGTIEAESWIFSKINKIYNIADKYSSEYFSFIDQAEILSKAFSKCLGMRLLTDAYGNLTYFQQDGRMMAERQYKPMESEVTNVSSFASWLNRKGIEFLYVMIPSPTDPEDEASQIAMGYEEYTNFMADELLTGLEANRVFTLDLREKMKEAGRSWSEAFFSYDHHMVPDNGLWAAGTIADSINEMMNIRTDDSVFVSDSYSVTKSKPVGTGGFYDVGTVVYAGKTEMEIYRPLFETKFVKTLPRYGMTLMGSFDDVMYAMYEYPEYNMYNHGIQPIKSYKNKSHDAAKIHILLLTESYSDVISPFLACAYSDIAEIDLRLFDGSLQTYIEETAPNLVVCMYSAYCQNSTGAENLFEFD